MWDKKEPSAPPKKVHVVTKCCSWFTFILHRCSASPILMGLMSIAVLWMAMFMGLSNFTLWESESGPKMPKGWKPPPPAPRNLAFEQRIGMGKHPHDPAESEEDVVKRMASSAHGFNIQASERIGARVRQLPDTVPKECSYSEADSLQKEMPTISVIIAFHDEHFITLARTVMSILHRTPERILNEIILIDDGSSRTELIDSVKEFLSKSVQVVKTRLIQLEQHVGIVGARMVGAREATGDVLVFMESHAEPNVGWIEPLLTLIQYGKNHSDSLTIAVPAIDIIDDDTFAYRASPAVRGGFDWDMVFKWEHLNDLKLTSINGVQFIHSPSFSGGVFAVDKKQFFETGGYDESMHEWGAENIEISLRANMCGGRVLITPCSRVGHVFRRRPPVPIASHPGPGVQDPTYWYAYNALRTALVWLVDDSDQTYLKYFFSAIPEAKRISAGDLSSRKEIRKKLSCQSFKWFLQNIYPDYPSPPSLANAGDIHYLSIEKPVDELSVDKTGKDNLENYISRSRRSGHLFHVVSGMCVVLGEAKPVRSVPAQILPGNSDSYACLKLAKCENARYQRWFETWQEELILDRSGCLAWSNAYNPAVMVSLCPPLIAKANKQQQNAEPTRKIPKSIKWRWLDGMTSSQLQVVVEDSPLSEKCLVARHFPTMCNDGRCGNHTDSIQHAPNNICAFDESSEVLLEPCTSDHNQRFQLLEF